MSEVKARQCDPNYFVIMEGDQEMYLGRCGISKDGHLVNRYPRLDGQDTDPSNLRHVRQMNIPLFQSVYHDYRLTSSPRRFLVVPVDQIPDLVDYQVDRQFRQDFALSAYFGCLPSIGAVLSDGTLASTRNGQPHYDAAMAMVETYMKLLGDQVVRDFFLFGERIRDPRTNCPGFDIDQTNYLSDGRNAFSSSLKNQPFVYVAAFKRESAFVGRPRVGILLLNWSLATDASAPSGISYVGAGSQSFNCTINAVDYGLSGLYELVAVQPDGSESFVWSGNVPAGDTTFPVVVPQATAKFLLLRPL